MVDRDKGSFVNHPNNNQYAYVVEKCRENGIDFYLTNPCFEFWLLLHFDEVHQLDKTSLLEKKKF
ncbi:MAG: RloB domain-containing protein [Bacillota bacterium]|nr:RloB domain-containing protein [Bacillota bacterium]